MFREEGNGDVPLIEWQCGECHAIKPIRHFDTRALLHGRLVCSECVQLLVSVHDRPGNVSVGEPPPPSASEDLRGQTPYEPARGPE